MEEDEDMIRLVTDHRKYIVTYRASTIKTYIINRVVIL